MLDAQATPVSSVLPQPTAQAPEISPQGLTTAQMLSEMQNFRKQQTAPQPEDAEKERLDRLYLHQYYSEYFEEVKAVYPEMTRDEFNRIAIAEAQDDRAGVAKLYDDASKKKMEMLSTKEDKPKNLHVEGVSSGVTSTKSPRSVNEGIQQALVYLRS